MIELLKKVEKTKTPSYFTLEFPFYHYRYDIKVPGIFNTTINSNTLFIHL